MQSEYEYVKSITDLFEENGAKIFIVELEADTYVRIARNKTENRLLHKPTKRNLAWSENNFKTTTKKYRMNSLPGEVPYKNYLRINNTNLSPEEVASMIKEKFGL